MPYYAILFDMDGIIVESETASIEFLKKRFHKLGKEISKTQLETLIGLDTKGMIEGIRSFLDYSISLEECREAVDPHIFFDSIINGELDIPLVEGFEELCSAFCGHLKYAIASGSPLDVIEAHAGRYNLAECFSVYISSDEVAHGKPSPDVYVEAARRLGVPAAQCIVLDDAPAGVAAGKAAGAHTIAVPSEYTGRFSFENADKICTSLMDARRYIERLIG